jgi:hypothetical protein
MFSAVNFSKLIMDKLNAVNFPVNDDQLFICVTIDKYNMDFFLIIQIMS